MTLTAEQLEYLERAAWRQYLGDTTRLRGVEYEQIEPVAWRRLHEQRVKVIEQRIIAMADRRVAA